MPSLTPAQQKAVLYFEGDAAIMAGAGSGKTTVLIEKVALLREKFHIPLENILVVTFTEKAAKEIQDRLAKRLSLEGLPENVSIGTIHAFATQILRNHSSEIPPDFRVLDENLSRLNELKTLTPLVLQKVNERHTEILEIVEKFGFKRSVRLLLELLSEAHHHPDMTHPYEATLQEMDESYRSKKQSMGVVDFNDLEKYLLKLLDTPAIQHTLQKKYSWIIVDEFQDTNPLQWKILSRLHDAHINRLVIVGDPRQSIYRFRGADPSLFLKISEQIKKHGGQLFYLNENFRSSKTVIDFVNRVSSNLFGETYPPLISVEKKSGLTSEVKLLPFDSAGTIENDRKTEAREIASILNQLHSNEGLRWNSIAVLFRTRKAIPAYQEVFKEAGIPFQSPTGELLLERPEILSILFLMKKHLQKSQPHSLSEVGLQYTPLASLTDMIPTNPLEDFLTTLFEKVTPLFEDPVLQKNIEEFQKLLSDLIPLGVHDLKTLVDTLATLRFEEARIPCPATLSTESVHLMTVHASKGLEFSVVVLADLSAPTGRSSKLFLRSSSESLLFKEQDTHVVGLKDRLIKDSLFEEIEKREKFEAREESKRLLYVALTRAKEWVILPLSKKEKSNSSKKASLWSEWLSG